jgi:hypothetical protein
MRTSPWHIGLAAFMAIAMAPQPARAVIVYSDPGRLTTMPVLSGGVEPGWQYIGTYGSFTGIPIGPRAWVTATHVSGPTGTLVYDSTTYASTRVATSGDLAVFQLNDGQPDFTQWAPVWQSTTTLADRITAGTLDVYMYGRGTDRGSAIVNGSAQTVGWNWVPWTTVEPLSYGTGNVYGLVNSGGNSYLQMPFFPVAESAGIFSTGDSGGAIFAFDNATSQWELIGINYAVELVAASSGGPNLNAAFFDARDYWYDTGSGWVQITGSVPVALSSYSTALPQKYSVLAPYIPVPEPSSGILAAVAAAGGPVVRILRRRIRSVGS